MQIYRRTLSSKATTTHDGYKSIGSFHSDNIEDLIRIPNDQYTPLELPFNTSKEYNSLSPKSSSSKHSSTIPFSNTHLYNKQYTNLDRTFAFLNHGAFGLALDVGLQRASSWRQFLEEQPLRYFDRYLLNHLAHSTRSLVDFISDEEYNSTLREGTALLQNVTSGMNAVIGGHARTKKNGFVFYYDIGYGSTKKIAQTYHGENAISILFEKEYLPQLQTINNSSSSFNRDENDWNERTAEIYIHALDETVHAIIKDRGRAAVHGSLLILDHITSNTAIHTPINAIAKHAKEEYGMLVCVDGAHSLLSLSLDMSAILSSFSSTTKNEGYADVYLTNCHKWLSSPRGVAAMFCTNKEIRDTLLSQPAVVSHGVNDGYLSRFVWDGCRDYSATLSLPIICDYWKSANVDMVRAMMQRNLKEGVRILVSQWHGVIDESNNLDDFTLVPLEMHAPMMALVRLPDDISGVSSKERKTSTDAKRLQDYFYDNHIEVPIKCINGILYARVSCHVYNEVREFERLAEVALKYKQ